VYTGKSRLDRAGRLRLLEPFALGTTARAAAELVGVNRNMVSRYYLALRQIIAEEMEKAVPWHSAQVLLLLPQGMRAALQ